MKMQAVDWKYTFNKNVCVTMYVYKYIKILIVHIKQMCTNDEKDMPM